ncbi:MAG: hypothetical protein GYA57_01695 [Myxococcales bacterium]|nr:hypothetical protein [Myxococcales bacterium]
MRRCSRRWVPLLLLLGLAAASPARGGGFEFGTNGAVANGRAGAFVARGDDPTSLYYNVATMGRMPPGTHLLFDCVLAQRRLSFQRAGEMDFAGANRFRVDGLPYPAVHDSAGPFPGPFFAVVTDLGLDSDFELGLGVFGPAAIGRFEYPTQSWVVNHDGERIPIPAPQRYDALNADILFVWPTLAVAWRITDDLAVGGAFQPGMLNIRFQQMSVAFGNGDDVVADIRANLDVWDWFVPGGMLGVWYRPWRYLELGLSVRAQDSIAAEGDIVTISNPYGVRDQEPVASDAWTDYNTAGGEHPPTGKVSFNWPWIQVRTGLRFVWPRDTPDVAGDALDPQLAAELGRLPPHVREWFDIELDVTYEMNSALDDFKIQIGGVVPMGYDLPNLAVRPDLEHPENSGLLASPHRWQDTVAVRLGGDVNLLDGALSLHWGASWESATVPPEWTRVDFAYFETWAVAAGITVRLPWWGLRVTASHQHLFMADRDITGGKTRILTAIERPEEMIPVVNNGHYEEAIDIFAVGLSASL